MSAASHVMMLTIRPSLTWGAITVGLLLLGGCESGGARPAAQTTQSTGEPRKTEEPGQPVIRWNRLLLGLMRSKDAHPATIHPTRSFAILHAAIHDAVSAIDGADAPYLVSVPAPRDASGTAAADAAAHLVLVGLYPALQPALDADYGAELALLPDDPARKEGVLVGEQVAREVLANRADDGSANPPPPFVPGSDPGDYRPTPPQFKIPKLTTWGQVRPFVLARGDQVRPAPPPAVTSDAYAAAMDEVSRLGEATSATRTADQTEAARFWAGPVQNTWNEIAATVAGAHGYGLSETARLFASLNLALADAAIASFDAKYAFLRWRPITAIQLVRDDPSWTPLATTPADPSYPSAHSALSAAAADVLACFFGDHQRFSASSDGAPGVHRAFQSFQAAAEEAGLSRIYAGVHTRLDHEAGQKLGHDVARFLVPRRPSR